MKKQNFLSIVKAAYNRSAFWVKKNSPELLLAGGLTFAAGSVVLAILGTKKLEGTIKPAKQKINNLKESIKEEETNQKLLDESNVSPEEINELESNVDIKEMKSELTSIYLKTGVETAKLYLPAALSFGMAVVCILGSHRVLKGREVALAAAYTTLNNSYKAYRKRVAEKLGEDIENEVYSNLRSTEAVTIDEKKEQVATVSDSSGWAIMFDSSNPNWEPNSILNLEWLEIQERLANQKLRANSYLFLSDVYKQLGVEPNLIPYNKLQGSHVVGWLYDPKDTTRDSYVSFGIRDRHTGEYTPGALNMRRASERNFIIDFNVDGDILTGKTDANGRQLKTFVTRLREVG